MYYEDRLKGAGFSRVLLGGRTPLATASCERALEERLQVRRGSRSSGGAALVDRIGVAGQLPSLAPLVGILLRERKAA